MSNSKGMDISQMPVTPGIYQISCLATGKVYVGSAVNVRKRMTYHVRMLCNDKHYNKKLQNAWNKYGQPSFDVKVLEHVIDRSSILDVEQQWIDKSCCVTNGYNLAANAAGGGCPHTEESKSKLSAKHTGKKMSDEARQKMSKSAASRPPISTDTRKKIVESLIGRVCSEATKAKIGKANSGKKSPLSEEVKLKVSAALKGIPKPPRTAEHSAKISAAKKGKKLGPPTAKHIANIKAAKARNKEWRLAA